jgi:hypothetical protein
MRSAVFLLVLGAAAMAAALFYGFTQGDGWSEVGALVAYPWFNVSLVDVYVGFALFAGWIVYRERSPLRAGIWIVLLLVLGNLVSCVYALLALARSGGDWTSFWLGRRATASGVDGP